MGVAESCRVRQRRACNPARAPRRSRRAYYNNANQVTFTTVNSALNGFAYDASGDVTNDNVNQYLYDAEGRIRAVASTPVAGLTVMTGYVYDADGTRVAKGTITIWSCDPSVNGLATSGNETDYVPGPGGEQVTEMAQDANMAWQHTNVWAAGTLLATYDLAGLHFYLDDPLGTRRAQTDPFGVLEQNCTSLPYGDQLNCSSATPGSGGSIYAGSLTAPTEHHFTGKERDSESGNDYFGARYYASSMGRWLSPDWGASSASLPYATLDDPQSLNLYVYVRNNPLANLDTDGHVCVALNASSGFCQRAASYTRYDHNPAINAQTRFFAAAAEVSTALGDVDLPGSSLFLSKNSANFLEQIGETLESVNSRSVQQILSGQLTGSDLDEQMVHIEQSAVQGQLNALYQKDPESYQATISEINKMFNSTVVGVGTFISDNDYWTVIEEVKKSLHRDIDFANQADREAIGNAMVKHNREKKRRPLVPGGCPAEFAHC